MKCVCAASGLGEQCWRSAVHVKREQQITSVDSGMNSQVCGYKLTELQSGIINCNNPIQFNGPTAHIGPWPPLRVSRWLGIYDVGFNCNNSEYNPHFKGCVLYLLLYLLYLN
jgi:hypothetical protein